MDSLGPGPDEPTQDDLSDWNANDRRIWALDGIVCSVIIGIADNSWLNAASWMAATMVLGWYGMPAVARAARRLSDRRKSFYLDVAIGWALYPGPPVGSLFGALIPAIHNLPISSYQGALIGLFVGPVIAAAEGVVVATLVVGVVWLVTGRRLED